MAPDDLTLAVRPAGSDTWVTIDPTTPRGRRLAASFGFTATHPTKENIAMSAIPVETAPVRPHLTVVQSNTERMGLLLAIRTKARQAFDYMLTLPRSAWGWVSRTFHLEAAQAFAGDIVGWVKAKAGTAARLVGPTGGAGLGLLSISTDIGRSLIGLAFKPVFWGLSMIHKAWVKAEDVLTVEDPSTTIDRGRNWVAERMADAREWLLAPRKGVLNRALVKAGQYLYPVFAMDSVPMQTARTVGTGLVGWQLVASLPLLPFGGPTLMAAAQFVLGALVSVATAAQAAPLAKKIWTKATSFFRKADAQATVVSQEAALKVTTIPAKDSASTARNRAERRAEQRSAQKTAAAKA